MRLKLRYWWLAAAVVVSACSEMPVSSLPDASSPSGAIPPRVVFSTGAAPIQCASVASSQTTVDTLLPQLFSPGRGRRGKAQGHSNNIEQARRNGDLATELAYVDSLVNYTLENYYAGTLIGGQSTATQQKVLSFIYALYCASQISPIPDLSGIFGAENTTLIRNSTPTTVVSTPPDDAAVKVDQGDVPATQDGLPFFGTFVSVFRSTNPLPTSLDWYGIDGYKQGAFEFVTNPPVTFTDPVLTGVCVTYDDLVVTSPSDLRIAHEVPVGYVPAVPGNHVVTTAGGTIEIGAPISTAPLGLDCDPLPIAMNGVFGRLLEQVASLVLPQELLAVVIGGGGIGGQMETFSPFAAVDIKLNATGTGPSSPQYIPVGSSSISAPVSVAVKTRHPVVPVGGVPTGQTPISGVNVAFAPSGFSPASAVTDGAGTAASSWTLIAGTNTGAGTASLVPLSFNGSPVNFSVSVIQILPVVVSTTPAPPNGTAGVSYTPFTFTATGGIGTFSWSVVAGALPNGLTLSSAGILSGTPTTAGSFTFTARATSGPAGLEATDDAQFTIVIATPFEITTIALPPAQRGVAYSAALNATGGTGTFTWSVISGSLPQGIVLGGNSISGTPSGTATTSTFTVQATSGGSSATRILTITVGSPTAITLSFDVGPSKNRCYAVNIPMTPGIRAKVTDQSGRLLTGVPVSIVAVTNNGSKVEVSPTTVNSVGGFANFGGPTINKTGGYALIISTAAPWPVSTTTSTKFNISPSC